MADRQQQYRGKKANMPLLLEGELGFCTDEEKLYIGTGTKNIPVSSENSAEVKELTERVDTLEEKIDAFTGGQITVKLLD